jgi:hypothetical protein
MAYHTETHWHVSVGKVTVVAAQYAPQIEFPAAQLSVPLIP